VTLVLAALIDVSRGRLAVKGRQPQGAHAELVEVAALDLLGNTLEVAAAESSLRGRTAGTAPGFLPSPSTKRSVIAMYSGVSDQRERLRLDPERQQQGLAVFAAGAEPVRRNLVLTVGKIALRWSVRTAGGLAASTQFGRGQLAAA
jgi:hypothetical protein